MRREVRRLIIAFVAVVFIALFVVPWLASFATDWLWFRQVGFTPVFMTSLIWRVVLFAAGGVVAYAILGGNIRLATRRAGKTPALFIHRVNQPPLDVSHILPRMLRLGALIASFLVAVSFSALWMTFVQAFHGATVGTRDALFGRDMGYYMFTLPAVAAVLNVAIALLVLALAATGVLYVLRGELPIGPKQGTPDRRAEMHIGLQLAGLFLLVALRLWFVRSAELLYSTTGPLVGASYTDVHFMLPGIRLSAVAAVAGMGLAVFGALRGRLLRYTIIAVGLYAGVGILARGVVPLAVQKLVVLPNELSKETPFLKDHIAATRAAWGIDSVQTRSLSGEASLTMADIKANAPTIDNVRLWERDLLQQTFKQLQEIRTYYDFVSVNDDRYTVDGKYRQVHLSARELNSNSLPTQTFINNRLTFTHGMGVTMAPVNQVTDEGLPVLFIKDLPPVSNGGHQADAAADLLRTAHRQLRVRGHEAEGVRLPVGRPEHLHVVQRDRWRAGGVVRAPCAVRLAVRVAQDPVLRRHHGRRTHHVPPEHHGTRVHGVAVPELRLRAVHGDHRRRPAEVGPGRVHHEQRVSLRRDGGRHRLHAEQREGDDRCLHGRDHRVRGGPERPRDPHVRSASSRASSSRCRPCRPTSSGTCAIRGSCSGSRPRSRRRTTWTNPTPSTIGKTSGRFRRPPTRART